MPWVEIYQKVRGLELHDQVDGVGDEAKGEDRTFATLDYPLTEEDCEDVEHNACSYHDEEVQRCDATDADRGDAGADTEDKEDVEDI